MSHSKIPQNNQRITSLDAIRGLAIFGILLANIQSWSGYRFIELEDIPSLYGSDSDDALYTVYQWLVSGKFYTIFCLLFGAGFWLQWQRKQGQAETWVPVYRKRLAWLLVFGLLHTVIWSGDILTLYALLGFVMLMMRKLSTVSRKWLAGFLLLCFMIPSFAMLMFAPGWPGVEQVAHKTYPTWAANDIVMVLTTGDILEYLKLNLHNVAWRWYDMLPDGRITRVLGLFLLGGLLIESGFFSKWGGHLRTIAIAAIMGFSGLALTQFLGGSAGDQWPVAPQQVFAKACSVIGQLGVAIMYMGLLIRADQHLQGWLRAPINWLANIGKTAFTCYISQTLIGLWLFSVFDLAGSVGLGALWLIAVVIYGAQVVLAHWWLSHFKMGPVESLWRRLSEAR
ncbi:MULTISPECIES: DUF418 domain-containing protein [unclassified Lentimonas]|uniref:DUF418 domain-containing protein n=1 Tax=unclassified Lentimonas TaxID=2630993 RepID=UPI0013216021|nr:MULTISPECIES: DUF418 domain-containing protein [unclassified Lentimonas]CAA6678393.1 Unannotated [Lentimonas sp. CC4]CAA6685485.1 Unannotated [Lentimonas sp. CC6]CAA7076933.1 Unannotated [Lentimonas sp. CC4]CAA7170484.1 Unannotated [Lentimonas sp. CC21]CAA7179820.1 Unannotated [Lentimonas sp. CC8]